MLLLLRLVCSSPSLTVVPSSSSLCFPVQFRRDEAFLISSITDLNCNQSFQLGMKWTFCNGSNPVVVDSSVFTQNSELFVPPRTFPFGVYQLTLNVSSNVTKSVHVQFNPSGITANLLPLRTSMITRGEEYDLHLNPGLYSLDLDEDQFNASVNPSSQIDLH